MSASDPYAVTHEEGLSVPCPFCGADEGRPCQGRRGDRIALHIDRRKAYIARVRRHRDRRPYDVPPEPVRPHARDAMTTTELGRTRTVIAEGRRRLSGQRLALPPPPRALPRAPEPEEDFC